MWNVIKETVLRPLSARVGTAIAVVLVAGGDWLCIHWDACGLVTDDGANVVARYVVAVAFLVLDLVVSAANRRLLKKGTQ